MRVCIDAASLGTQNSLVINLDGSCEWLDRPSDCLASLGSGPGVSIESLAQMQGLSIEGLKLSDFAHVRSFESLGISECEVPWAMVLGRRKFTARLKMIIGSIQEVIRDPEVMRYVETYRQGNEFLKTLQRPRVDINRMRKHRDDAAGGLAPLSALASFSPDGEGFAPAIEYDRISTSTGRLKVSRGPMVLTLQKEFRDIISSRTGGSIYEVDFVSLEPRVSLNIMGTKPPRDIYEGIREKMKMSSVTRSAIKQAVISALYGSSSSALAEALGGRREAQNLVWEVKEYFQVTDLVARLRSAMVDSEDRLHNYFGRPLVDIGPDDPDAKLISYYLQSTAVDVALLGFSQLVKRVSSLGIIPIYVIHDAVVLDVPSGADRELQLACDEGVDLDMGRFELGLKRIG